VEGDITACFDEISHPALMDRVRHRIGDKRVLALVKAFLKAGILTQDRQMRDTDIGTPQGDVLSPLPAKHRPVHARSTNASSSNGTGGAHGNAANASAKGLGVCRFIRYADDFLILVRGDRRHAEACATRPQQCCPDGTAPVGSQDTDHPH
jgi:RNA-directed DNA polymerase